MENINDIIKEYNIDEKKKSYPAWQLWALEFCQKYEVNRKDYGTIMKYAKHYMDSLDYLRGVEGWMADYPNRGGNVVKLFLWKLKEDKKQRSGSAYI